MRTILCVFAAVVTVISALPVRACDACGCGAGGMYFGLMPQLSRNAVGTRYRSASYDTHMQSARFRTREHFQTAELWARYYITPSLEIQAVLPYGFYEQSLVAQTKALSGIADAVAIANVAVITPEQSELEDVLLHSVFAGGGLKVPLGRYRYGDGVNEVANPAFQLGTGSIDFIASARYNLRYNDVGVTADVLMRFPTENSRGYRFGNAQVFTVAGFYSAAVATSVRLVPSAGVILEHAAVDILGGGVVDNTGGSALFGSLGMDVMIESIAVGVSAAFPVSGSYGSGVVLPDSRLSAHLSFLW